MSLYFMGLFYYGVSVFSLTSPLDFYSFWCFMEILTLSFIFLCSMTAWKSSGIHTSVFFFFVVQSMASLGLLYLFSCAGLVSSMEGLVAVNLLFLVKMGLFPFSSWVYKSFCDLPPLTLMAFLIPHKIPFLMFLSNFSSEIFWVMMVVSMFYGAFLVFSSMNLKDLVVSSSIYGIAWLGLMLDLCNTISFFLFLSIYSGLTFMALLEGNSSVNPRGFYLVFFLLGLPPMSLFLMKILVFSGLPSIFGWCLWAIWLNTFISSIGYIKFLYNFLNKKYSATVSNGSGLLFSSGLMLALISIFMC